MIKSFEDVLEECAKIDDWEVFVDGGIRVRLGGMFCCPLTSGIFESDPCRAADVSNQRLRMHISHAVAIRVIRAADKAVYPSKFDDEDTSGLNDKMQVDRAAMLTAFGLTEPITPTKRKP